MAIAMTDDEIRAALTRLDERLAELPDTFVLENPAGPLRSSLDAGTHAKLTKQLSRYAALLLEHNRHVNLTAITDGDGIYTRHFLDALSLLPLVDRAAEQAPAGRPVRVIDVGTGAGLPGLILAMARPELEIVLNDALKKRLRFLDEVIEELGLEHVRTVHARAEDLGRDPDHRGRYDVVTARAVAALPVLAEYCLPLCREGGVWLAPKTLSEAPETMRQAVHLLGGGSPDRWMLPELGDHAYCIYRTPKVKATPKRFPRRAGTPAKKPL